jgi:hypothetical protein
MPSSAAPAELPRGVAPPGPTIVAWTAAKLYVFGLVAIDDYLSSGAANARFY